jgi:hypothetical protein
MALTKAQWLKKLKQSVPKWVFEKGNDTEAVFDGMAELLYQAQLNHEDHIRQTFIDTADEEFLDIHAEERSVERSAGDSINTYRDKIKNILNKSNCPDLKALVDAVLIVGESTFIENHQSNINFLNRGSFLNRNIINFKFLYNAFTILVDYQVPEAVTFANRGNFLSRNDTLGANDSLISVLQNAVDIVNKNKAFGTVYRLIERRK